MATRLYDKQVAKAVKIASGVTVVEGNLLGRDTNGNAILATNLAAGIVMALDIAVAPPDNGYVAVSPIGHEDGFTGLTIGAAVYLGVAGGVTQTRPAAAGDLIQAVGGAESATEILFNVVASGILYQAAATSLLT